MTDYLYPGKTTTDQYYAQPTFKLLNDIKQKHWQKLSVRSLTFSWQCTAHKSLVAQQAVHDCEFVKLNHPAYRPDLAPSDYFLIRNLKSDLVEPGLQTMNHWWSLSRHGLRVKTEKINFQGINSWEEKLKKCIDVAGKYVETWQYIWYNTLTFYSQVAKLFHRPS